MMQLGQEELLSPIECSQEDDDAVQGASENSPTGTRCVCVTNFCVSLAYTLRGGLRESDIEILERRDRRERAEKWSNVTSDGGTSEPHMSSAASQNLDDMELVAFDFETTCTSYMSSSHSGPKWLDQSQSK